MAGIDELLRTCSVRIVTAGGSGTGAFVGPGLVLTCAHVIDRKAAGLPRVFWSGREHVAEIVECHSAPFADLTLLRVPINEHPCVLFDPAVELGDSLYAFGYPDGAPGGDSVTLEYEGPSLRPDELHKLKQGQVRPGFSGAALLNRRTGCVCGVLHRTRDRASDLGGCAVPVSAVFAAMPSLVGEQQQHHATDRRWHDCLDPAQRARLPRDGDAAANPFLGESDEVIGRDDELRRVFDKLRAGNHCSVVGPHGSGKSALLRLIRPGLYTELNWAEGEIAWLNFRTIDTLRELQEALVDHLGGERASDWRSLLQDKPPRLVVLENLGGMDPGASGLKMRRWLRGLDDFGTRLLPLSNERLDVLFRKDDPLRDSPLAGIDPIPVILEPLPAANCRRLVEARLARSKLPFAAYAELCRQAQQPGALLARCAKRFEEQRPAGQRSVAE